MQEYRGVIMLWHKNQCFQLSALLRKSAISVLPGNFCTWFFNFKKKNPPTNFFLLAFFCLWKKNDSLVAELICARRTRKIVEENGDQILLLKENKNKNKRKLLSCLRRIRKPKRTLHVDLLTDKISCK